MGKKSKNALSFVGDVGSTQDKFVWIMIILTAVLMLLTACSSEPADPSQAELIRVGSSVVTVRQFKQIQDLSQDYYWQDQDTEDKNSAEPKALRLLSQITEELLLKEKAQSLNLTVNDAELDAAVRNIKSDYPEGTFEQVLLENAVSFDFWRQRLRARLLMNKVIEKELESNVIITPEDVASYYRQHYAGMSGGQSNSGGSGKDINEIIVRRLRKLKAEKAYKEWIKELQQTYPVQVDWEAWKTLEAP